ASTVGAAPIGSREESVYFIGVDGGTGDIEAVVMERSGRVVGTGRGGPSNDPDHVGRMHPDVGEHLVGAIRRALGDAGLSARRLMGLSLNLSGDRSALTRQNACEWLAPLDLPPECPLAVHEDGLSAWAAGGFPDPSLWVLLGTNCGSGAMLDGRVREHPLDRLDLDAHQGELVGGARLGTLALGRAIRSRFGGRLTRLYDAYRASLGVADVDGLIAWSREHATSDVRADLCKVAAEVASDGDPVARELFERAGRVIGEATVALGQYLGLEHRQTTILLTGKLWRAGHLLLDAFREATLAGLPRAEVRINEISQARGAALLAMREAGLEIDDAVYRAARS
ncbi:MAG: hypothetical protein M3O34_16300, partial [Chloroflexota bacterium]|nr:hypothetical protein [Chloroflexota bacterium]